MPRDDWRELTLDAEDALLKARRAEHPYERDRLLVEAEIRIKQAKRLISKLPRTVTA
jgi:hypothetical protein